MRLGGGIIVLAAMACSGATRLSAPLLSGTFRSDCAPYDGPAFLVTLPQPARGTEFWLRANVPLNQAAGSWQHELQSGPGQATIVRCQSSGERACKWPSSGSFRITMTAPARMSGTLEASFPGEPRARYRFAASRKDPPAPTFCG